MTPKMVLVPIHEVKALQPAAMYEADASRYMMLSLNSFRELVRNGTIPARAHAGRIRAIYLKEDLDEYLRSLPRKSIAENSSMFSDGGRQAPRRG